jgi:hypothetical protein
MVEKCVLTLGEKDKNNERIGRKRGNVHNGIE